MTGDVRSLAGGLPSEFDFNSQTGILFVLRAIRAAAIDSPEKNKLKDLVFIYSTGGKDEGTKKKLQDTLTAFGVTPESVLLEVKKVESVPGAGRTPVAGAPGFPINRPTPQFTVVSTLTPNATAAKKLVPISTMASPVVPSEKKSDQLPVSEMPVEKITPVTPVAKTIPPPPAPAPRPMVAIPTKIVLEPTTPPNSDMAAPVARPVTEIIKPTTLSASVEQTTATVASDQNQALTANRMERIRVIKSDVNARVGNPVNLVDVDNTVGREYMSALLEAMKLLSTASEQESAQAMNRLEGVYTQVLSLLETKNQENAPAPAVSVPTYVPEVIDTTAVVSPVQNNEPILSDDFGLRSKVVDRAVDTQSTSSAVWGEPVVPVTTQVQSPEVVQNVVQAVTQQDAVTVARLSTPPAEPLRPAVSMAPAKSEPEITQSVNSVVPLRAITDLPTADEVSASEAMGNNPLYTKDVDAGLDQLLSEWSIFKKSGLFGTGPKGREHPLYVKISAMQLPLILSGRFEGGTQEIKQSITDYMNGWRYEQGIIYEASETLDQYLRRVIRHIIDLQKTKRRS